MADLVTKAAVEASLRRELSAEELGHLPGILAEVEVLLAGYLGVDFDVDYPDGPPRSVEVVAARITARAYTSKPEDVGLQSTQAGAGPFQQTRHYTPESRSGGVYLTQVDKVMLSGLRGGFVSAPMASGVVTRGEQE